MEWWQAILRNEHDATDDSFVMKLRRDAHWDKTTYNRLFEAMLACCKAHDERHVIERWIAEVLWYLSWWPKLQAEGFWPGSRYHESAAVNFDHLAWWLFAKQTRSDNEFERLE